MAQSARDMPGAAETAHSHPTEAVYIRIALILAVITLVEVVIYYLESFNDILVPSLIFLSALKFIIVVGYFMHLKFDDRRLTWVFGFGFVLSLGTYVAIVVMHHFHQVVTFFSNMIS
ncbi:MAG TPA: cytochrome C oxidase subunit IV family protein [Thermomicrobiales bacterium]|nr:cytochrome C oxidase subunit IV family protein [Thermomicrobiales bacterium]